MLSSFFAFASIKPSNADVSTTAFPSYKLYNLLISEFQKFTDITKQRYPGDRKHKSEDVPQIEKRTECPRQRYPGDRKQENPDVPKKEKGDN